MRFAPRVSLFALATLAPLPFLVAAALFGGGWALVALLYITTLMFLIDLLSARAAADAPEGSEFPAADGLSVTLALAHFPLLALAVAATAGATGLGPWERLAVFLAMSLFFGQVSNSNAHELAHRAGRGLRLLGETVYASVGYGHHASAHRLVHHLHVATPKDPNSARRGEGFWRFAARAWPAEWRAGHAAEARIAAHRGRAHVYWRYAAVTALAAALAVWGLGWEGLAAWAAISAYTQVQLLLSDYVQHYGLRRAQRDDGSYAPVSAAHSWDAPHPLSGLWMLHAPRHSDHHAHPARPYPALRLETGAPRLPLSLPAMAFIALIPPLWFKVMNRRLPRRAA